MDRNEGVEFGELFRTPQYIGVSFSWSTPEAASQCAVS